MKFNVLICARGGSKGLKNKNILLFKKMPLISHTIKIAKKSKVFSNKDIRIDIMKKKFYGRIWEN